MLINDGQARRIASDWHGGQGSSLCSLATTGAIQLDLVREEIEDLLACAEMGEKRCELLRELLALKKYVRAVGNCSAQPGWSHLWDETPVSIDHT
jgi:hypothetical protein